MTICIGLNHITHYQYARPTVLSPHVIRLRPAAHTRTPISAYALKIRPTKHFINWQQDPFGNYLARVVFPEPATELYVEVDVIADLTVINPFDFFLEEYAEKYPFEYDAQLRQELAPYLEIREQGPLLKAWLHSVDKGRCPTNDFLVALNQRLAGEIRYSIRMEPGIRACEETLGLAVGSCRDTAWLLVQILRHLGLAARFVSGYLVQLTADVKALDGPSGPEQDFTDLHAWAEVYIPGAGWIGLDPTSGLFAGEGHIPLACTPDPSSAAPITGFSSERAARFEHFNFVRRIHEDPRVTKPYSGAQWAAINALGAAVDQQLLERDVRLTMGGEPTFVSIDDMDGDEWNTAALGDNKRRLADDLLRRLAGRFADGGVLHHAQGKWYPGEPLPRWALGVFWRIDNVPIWRNPGLIAIDNRDYGYGVEHAQLFARELTKRLAIEEQRLVPGYEDPLYYLWKEGRTPANVDLTTIDLKQPAERQGLARVLQEGLQMPRGYALPLQWDYGKERWRSSAWEFRGGSMFLVPGDSPMGLRLPLDSLPWTEERDSEEPQSLFEEREPLGDAYGEVTRRYSRAVSSAADQGSPDMELADAPDAGQPGHVVHTALCVEARNGKLHVFLPPLTKLEHYLDLVASIEATASALAMPVSLEGYDPPRDWRVQRLLVTPDPGVIEVNVQPASRWDELVNIVTTLYEEARLTRLGTEKFMLDGRHTGTGGGNHITLGGATPMDSPMLRRPDLLQSLITFWQHHPGLSYLFSGMFLGPTSQSPRVDEARNESLYELEIAFQQMPEGEVPAPWLVDRLLRNLLIDITGNTHRAEFCIDKLYSPNSDSGRLGLLELRAFEMPPHPQMSLVQMLLIRAMVARFWEHPYRQKLVRWGTAIHDRFMLPHYVRADLFDVVQDLNAHGYPFQIEWLDPFFEFRFPHYGSVNIRDVHMELRSAIEPWHVLGEEVTRFGTARYVDSSVERVQLKVTGLTDSRYIATCNGRRVPLRPTGTHGEYVAGVRFRAWQPPSALHPTIGTHAPLVFDLIDTWNGCSIGGCTYHVAHPGGRSHETFPVNAFAAESRRIVRFWPYGHTAGTVSVAPERYGSTSFNPEGHPPGPMQPPAEEINRDYPYTLDLRRQRE